MASDSTLNWKKIRAYWKRAFVKTRKDTEIMSLVWEAIMSGLVPVILGVKMGVIGTDEIKELFFLALAGAACGVIIPFTLKLLFVTPEKLYREIEKRLTTAENQLREKNIEIQKVVESSTNRQIPGLAILSSICISLTLILVVQNSKYQELKVAPQPVVASAPYKPIPKPKPDINTSNPPAPAVASTPVMTNIPPPQMASETDSMGDMVSLDDAVARITAQKEREATIAKIQAKTFADQEWTTNLSDRDYCLETLWKIMEKEAPLWGDSVTKNVGFLQCLPKTINMEDNSNYLGYIRFTAHTNVHFVVSIVNYGPSKALRISSSCGNMDLYSAYGHVREPWRMLNIPSYPLGDIQNVAIPSRAVIDEGLDLLVEAQIKGSGLTNISVTNIVDKK